MSPRSRAFLACASAFAACVELASLPGVARAEGLAARLVRVLDRPGRAHPLADRRGNVPLSVKLPARVDARAFGLLPVAPGIGAVRLPAEDVGPFAAAHPGFVLGVAPPRRPLLDVSPMWTHVTQFRQATGGLAGQGVVVGVVDTGLDVRHPDLLTKDGHSRVAWMLTSGAPRGLHPDVEEDFGCTSASTPCAVYAAADIDAILAGTLTDQGDVSDGDGHGTHVTSIAAGNGGPSVNASPRYVGLAPEATIIVAAPSPDGSFYDTDILNGARFVFDRAQALGAPAVLNLSLGSDYGSHDGTSALETGLEAMVGDTEPGRVIVIAAGNSGELDASNPACSADDPTACVAPYLGIHTEAHVSDGEVVRVPMIATADVQDGQVFVWITFRPGDSVSVGFEGPCGSSWVGMTGPGDESQFSEGGANGSVINDVTGADEALNGATNSAIVELDGGWSATSSCGASEFTVLLRGSGDASLWITAEKDALEGMFFEQAMRPGTINVPATGPGLLAAGCTVNRITWSPLDGPPVTLSSLGDDPNPVGDSACYFSSSGPTPFGVQKPEIAAPGGFVAAAMAAAADPRKFPGGLFDLGGCPPQNPFCAVVDEYHAIATGTSMSTPHVAGAVALLMNVDPSLTQARATAALQAGARFTSGHVPDLNQLGPGSLDVEGARVALLDMMSAPVAASPSRSWYSLSSAYARPDPTWPVWGAIELRTAGGDVAAGIDGSKLALSVSGGGVVLQRITQVRQGLFRFALAGRPVDLGNEITIDVSYAGTSLGKRTLPVGWDNWSASDPEVTAVGACGVARAGAGADVRGEIAVAGLAIVALRRRRRRPRQGAPK